MIIERRYPFLFLDDLEDETQQLELPVAKQDKNKKKLINTQPSLQQQEDEIEIIGKQKTKPITVSPEPPATIDLPELPAIKQPSPTQLPKPKQPEPPALTVEPPSLVEEEQIEESAPTFSLIVDEERRRAVDTTFKELIKYYNTSLDFSTSLDPNVQNLFVSVKKEEQRLKKLPVVLSDNPQQVPFAEYITYRKAGVPVALNVKRVIPLSLIDTESGVELSVRQFISRAVNSLLPYLSPEDKLQITDEILTQIDPKIYRGEKAYKTYKEVLDDISKTNATQKQKVTPESIGLFLGSEYLIDTIDIDTKLADQVLTTILALDHKANVTKETYNKALSGERITFNISDKNFREKVYSEIKNIEAEINDKTAKLYDFLKNESQSASIALQDIFTDVDTIVSRRTKEILGLDGTYPRFSSAVVTLSALNQQPETNYTGLLAQSALGIAQGILPITSIPASFSMKEGIYDNPLITREIRDESFLSQYVSVAPYLEIASSIIPLGKIADIGTTTATKAIQTGARLIPKLSLKPLKAFGTFQFATTLEKPNFVKTLSKLEKPIRVIDTINLGMGGVVLTEQFQQSEDFWEFVASQGLLIGMMIPKVFSGGKLFFDSQRKEDISVINNLPIFKKGDEYYHFAKIQIPKGEETLTELKPIKLSEKQANSLIQSGVPVYEWRFDDSIFSFNTPLTTQDGTSVRLSDVLEKRFVESLDASKKTYIVVRKPEGFVLIDNKNIEKTVSNPKYRKLLEGIDIDSLKQEEYDPNSSIKIDRFESRMKTWLEANEDDDVLFIPNENIREFDVLSNIDIVRGIAHDSLLKQLKRTKPVRSALTNSNKIRLLYAIRNAIADDLALSLSAMRHDSQKTIGFEFDKLDLDALKLAIQEGLIDLTGTSLKITEKGEEFLNSIQDLTEKIKKETTPSLSDVPFALDLLNLSADYKDIVRKSGVAEYSEFYRLDPQLIHIAELTPEQRSAVLFLSQKGLSFIDSDGFAYIPTKEQFISLLNSKLTDDLEEDDITTLKAKLSELALGETIPFQVADANTFKSLVSSALGFMDENSNKLNYSTSLQKLTQAQKLITNEEQRNRFAKEYIEPLKNPDSYSVNRIKKFLDVTKSLTQLDSNFSFQTYKIGNESITYDGVNFKVVSEGNVREITPEELKSEYGFDDYDIFKLTVPFVHPQTKLTDLPELNIPKKVFDLTNLSKQIRLDQDQLVLVKLGNKQIPILSIGHENFIDFDIEGVTFTKNTFNQVISSDDNARAGLARLLSDAQLQALWNSNAYFIAINRNLSEPDYYRVLAEELAHILTIDIIKNSGGGTPLDEFYRDAYPNLVNLYDIHSDKFSSFEEFLVELYGKPLESFSSIFEVEFDEDTINEYNEFIEDIYSELIKEENQAIFSRLLDLEKRPQDELKLLKNLLEYGALFDNSSNLTKAKILEKFKQKEQKIEEGISYYDKLAELKASLENLGAKIDLSKDFSFADVINTFLSNQVKLTKQSPTEIWDEFIENTNKYKELVNKILDLISQHKDILPTSDILDIIRNVELKYDELRKKVITKLITHPESKEFLKTKLVEAKALIDFSSRSFLSKYTQEFNDLLKARRLTEKQRMLLKSYLALNEAEKTFKLLFKFIQQHRNLLNINDDSEETLVNDIYSILKSKNVKYEDKILLKDGLSLAIQALDYFQRTTNRNNANEITEEELILETESLEPYKIEKLSNAKDIITAITVSFKNQLDILELFDQKERNKELVSLLDFYQKTFIKALKYPHKTTLINQINSLLSERNIDAVIDEENILLKKQKEAIKQEDIEKKEEVTEKEEIELKEQKAKVEETEEKEVETQKTDEPEKKTIETRLKKFSLTVKKVPKSVEQLFDELFEKGNFDEAYKNNVKTRINSLFSSANYNNIMGAYSWRNTETAKLLINLTGKEFDVIKFLDEKQTDKIAQINQILSNIKVKSIDKKVIEKVFSEIQKLIDFLSNEIEVYKEEWQQEIIDELKYEQFVYDYLNGKDGLFKELGKYNIVFYSLFEKYKDFIRVETKQEQRKKANENKIHVTALKDVGAETLKKLKTKLKRKTYEPDLNSLLSTSVLLQRLQEGEATKKETLEILTDVLSDNLFLLSKLSGGYIQSLITKNNKAIKNQEATEFNNLIRLLIEDNQLTLLAELERVRIKPLNLIAKANDTEKSLQAKSLIHLIFSASKYAKENKNAKLHFDELRKHAKAIEIAEALVRNLYEPKKVLDAIYQKENKDKILTDLFSSTPENLEYILKQYDIIAKTVMEHLQEQTKEIEKEIQQAKTAEKQETEEDVTSQEFLFDILTPKRKRDEDEDEERPDLFFSRFSPFFSKFSSTVDPDSISKDLPPKVRKIIKDVLSNEKTVKEKVTLLNELTNFIRSSNPSTLEKILDYISVDKGLFVPDVSNAYARFVEILKEAIGTIRTKNLKATLTTEDAFKLSLRQSIEKDNNPAKAFAIYSAYYPVLGITNKLNGHTLLDYLLNDNLKITTYKLQKDTLLPLEISSNLETFIQVADKLTENFLDIIKPEKLRSHKDIIEKIESLFLVASYGHNGLKDKYFQFIRNLTKNYYPKDEELAIEKAIEDKPQLDVFFGFYKYVKSLEKKGLYEQTTLSNKLIYLQKLLRDSNTIALYINNKIESGIDLTKFEQDFLETYKSFFKVLAKQLFEGLIDYLNNKTYVELHNAKQLNTLIKRLDNIKFELLNLNHDLAIEFIANDPLYKMESFYSILLAEQNKKGGKESEEKEVTKSPFDNIVNFINKTKEQFSFIYKKIKQGELPAVRIPTFFVGIGKGRIESTQDSINYLKVLEHQLNNLSFSELLDIYIAQKAKPLETDERSEFFIPEQFASELIRSRQTDFNTHQIFIPALLKWKHELKQELLLTTIKQEEINPNLIVALGFFYTSPLLTEKSTVATKIKSLPFRLSNIVEFSPEIKEVIDGSKKFLSSKNIEFIKDSSNRLFFLSFEKRLEEHIEKAFSAIKSIKEEGEKRTEALLLTLFGKEIDLFKDYKPIHFAEILNIVTQNKDNILQPLLDQIDDTYKQYREFQTYLKQFNEKAKQFFSEKDQNKLPEIEAELNTFFTNLKTSFNKLEEKLESNKLFFKKNFLDIEDRFRELLKNYEELDAVVRLYETKKKIIDYVENNNKLLWDYYSTLVNTMADILSSKEEVTKLTKFLNLIKTSGIGVTTEDVEEIRNLIQKLKNLNFSEALEEGGSIPSELTRTANKIETLILDLSKLALFTDLDLIKKSLEREISDKELISKGVKKSQIKNLQAKKEEDIKSVIWSANFFVNNFLKEMRKSLKTNNNLKLIPTLENWEKQFAKTSFNVEVEDVFNNFEKKRKNLSSTVKNIRQNYEKLLSTKFVEQTLKSKLKAKKHKPEEEEEDLRHIKLKEALEVEPIEEETSVEIDASGTMNELQQTLLKDLKIASSNILEIISFDSNVGLYGSEKIVSLILEHTIPESDKQNVRSSYIKTKQIGNKQIEIIQMNQLLKKLEEYPLFTYKQATTKLGISPDIATSIRTLLPNIKEQYLETLERLTQHFTTEILSKQFSINLQEQKTLSRNPKELTAVNFFELLKNPNTKINRLLLNKLRSIFKEHKQLQNEEVLNTLKDYINQSLQIIGLTQEDIPTVLQERETLPITSIAIFSLLNRVFNNLQKTLEQLSNRNSPLREELENLLAEKNHLFSIEKLTEILNREVIEKDDILRNLHLALPHGFIAELVEDVGITRKYEQGKIREVYYNELYNALHTIALAKNLTGLNDAIEIITNFSDKLSNLFSNQTYKQSLQEYVENLVDNSLTKITNDKDIVRVTLKKAGFLDGNIIKQNYSTTRILEDDFLASFPAIVVSAHSPKEAFYPLTQKNRDEALIILNGYGDEWDGTVRIYPPSITSSSVSIHRNPSASLVKQLANVEDIVIPTSDDILTRKTEYERIELLKKDLEQKLQQYNIEDIDFESLKIKAKDEEKRISKKQYERIYKSDPFLYNLREIYKLWKAPYTERAVILANTFKQFLRSRTQNLEEDLINRLTIQFLQLFNQTQFTAGIDIGDIEFSQMKDFFDILKSIYKQTLPIKISSVTESPYPIEQIKQSLKTIETPKEEADSVEGLLKLFHLRYSREDREQNTEFTINEEDLESINSPEQLFAIKDGLRLLGLPPITSHTRVLKYEQEQERLQKSYMLKRTITLYSPNKRYAYDTLSFLITALKLQDRQAEKVSTKILRALRRKGLQHVLLSYAFLSGKPGKSKQKIIDLFSTTTTNVFDNKTADINLREYIEISKKVSENKKAIKENIPELPENYKLKESANYNEVNDVISNIFLKGETEIPVKKEVIKLLSPFKTILNLIVNETKGTIDFRNVFNDPETAKINFFATMLTPVTKEGYTLLDILTKSKTSKSFKALQNVENLTQEQIKNITKYIYGQIKENKLNLDDLPESLLTVLGDRILEKSPELYSYIPEERIFRRLTTIEAMTNKLGDLVKEVLKNNETPIEKDLFFSRFSKKPSQPKDLSHFYLQARIRLGSELTDEELQKLIVLHSTYIQDLRNPKLHLMQNRHKVTEETILAYIDSLKPRGAFALLLSASGLSLLLGDSLVNNPVSHLLTPISVATGMLGYKVVNRLLENTVGKAIETTEQSFDLPSTSDIFKHMLLFYKNYAKQVINRFSEIAEKGEHYGVLLNTSPAQAIQIDVDNPLYAREIDVPQYLTPLAKAIKLGWLIHGTFDYSNYHALQESLKQAYIDTMKRKLGSFDESLINPAVRDYIQQLSLIYALRGGSVITDILNRGIEELAGETLHSANLKSFLFGIERFSTTQASLGSLIASYTPIGFFQALLPLFKAFGFDSDKVKLLRKKVILNAKEPSNDLLRNPLFYHHLSFYLSNAMIGSTLLLLAFSGFFDGFLEIYGIQSNDEDDDILFTEGMYPVDTHHTRQVKRTGESFGTIRIGNRVYRIDNINPLFIPILLGMSLRRLQRKEARKLEELQKEEKEILEKLNEIDTNKFSTEDKLRYEKKLEQLAKEKEKYSKFMRYSRYIDLFSMALLRQQPYLSTAQSIFRKGTVGEELANIALSTILPIPSFIRRIDQIQHPNVKETTNLAEEFINKLPFVRRLLPDLKDEVNRTVIRKPVLPITPLSAYDVNPTTEIRKKFATLGVNVPIPQSEETKHFYAQNFIIIEDFLKRRKQELNKLDEQTQRDIIKYMIDRAGRQEKEDFERNIKYYEEIFFKSPEEIKSSVNSNWKRLIQAIKESDTLKEQIKPLPLLASIVAMKEHKISPKQILNEFIKEKRKLLIERNLIEQVTEEIETKAKRLKKEEELKARDLAEVKEKLKNVTANRSLYVNYKDAFLMLKLLRTLGGTYLTEIKQESQEEADKLTQDDLSKRIATSKLRTARLKERIYAEQDKLWDELSNLKF